MLQLKKGFAHLFLVLIIFVAGMGGLGYYAYKNGQVKTPLSKSPVPTTSTKSEPTNWEVYTSADGGYQIEHPVDWTFNNYPDSGSKGHATFIYDPIEESFLGEIRIVTPESLRGEVWADLSSDQFFDLNSTFWVKGSNIGGGPGTDYENPEIIIINGYKAVLQKSQYSSEYENVGPWINTHIYYIPVNETPDEIVHVSFQFDDRKPRKEEVLEEFDQILSTFKFAE